MRTLLIAFLFLSIFATVFSRIQSRHGHRPSGNKYSGRKQQIKPVGQTCSALWECEAVSEHLDYVDCVSGTCKCLVEQGFSGNATRESKCDCLTPSEVIKSNGQPYCLNVKAATSSAYHDNLQIAQAIKFLQNTIWPTPALIMAGQVDLTTLFAENVTSRISPAGSFPGFQGVVEYFYGFVAFPTTTALSVNIIQITSTGNVVAVKGDILVNQTIQEQGEPPFFNITVFAFLRFTQDGLIYSIDVSVPNLGALLDLPLHDVEARKARIYYTCDILVTQPYNNKTGTCHDYPIYDSFEDCVQFMSSIDYGTYYRINANSFSCRLLHMGLTYFAPEDHCEHCSRTGGDSCLDFTYEDYYNYNF